MDARTRSAVATPAAFRVVRLRTLIRLRWFAVSGQLLVTLMVSLGLGYEVALAPILVVVAAGVWANLFAMFSPNQARTLSPRDLMGHLLFDTFQIGAVLYLTGGIVNPFSVWLILPAMLASASLERGRAAIVAGVVVAVLTFLAIPNLHLPLPWSTEGGMTLPPLYNFGTLGALLLGVGFTSAYAYQVAADQTKLSAALDATQKVLSREERLTALGGLAAAAAHELGTPLGTIQITAKEMAQDLPEGPLKEDAELLISQTQRCQAILKRLSHSGEGGDARHAVLSLDDMLHEAAKPFLTQDTKCEVRFIFDPSSTEGPPEDLNRMPEVIYSLRTLVENSVKYADSQVEITADWTEDTLTVVIEDDGPGFSQEVLSRLGEPYPRMEPNKRDAKAGLGLGFFIAKTLLERTGASILFGNKKRLSGAWVELSWPLANLRARPISMAAE